MIMVYLDDSRLASKTSGDKERGPRWSRFLPSIPYLNDQGSQNVAILSAPPLWGYSKTYLCQQEELTFQKGALETAEEKKEILVGSIMRVVNITRLDLSFVAQNLEKFCDDLVPINRKAAIEGIVIFLEDKEPRYYPRLGCVWRSGHVYLQNDD